MNHFPVSSSILSTRALADFIGQQYALTIVEVRLLKCGINHSYLISTQNEHYVLRIYCHNWRTVEEISEELRLLKLLKENDISISYPIPNLKENDILEIEAPEGRRFAVLFSFAYGEKIYNYSEKTHGEIGKMMAQIHLLTENLVLKRETYNYDSLIEKPLTQIANFLSTESEEFHFLNNTKELLKSELESTEFSAVPSGAVHLDIWFDNLNIDKDGRITLFDFDFCGNGPLCLDIAYYVMQLHNTEREENNLKSRLRAFMEGYESVRKISPEEKRFLPILGLSIYYFYLGTQCRRFEDWSNSFLNEVYLKRYINGLVKRYYDIAFK